MARLDDLRIEGDLPRPARRRRGPWAALFWLALLLGGGGYALRVYFPAAAGKLAALRPQPAVEVFTVTAPSAGPSGAISAGGYLEVIPPGPVQASTLLAGKLLSVDVVAGDRVRQGQVLARLDPGIYAQQAAVAASRVALARAELQRQRAGFRAEEIAAAGAGVSEAQARLTRAAADFGRAQQLYSAGVLSRSQLDAAQSELDQARSAMQARQAQQDLLLAGTRPDDVAIYQAALAAAEAELAQAQFNVAQCVIRAPVGGVVYEQLAQPGDWLAPDSGDPAAGAVVSLFDPAQVQAWCDVNQRDSAGVRVGQRVTLSTDAQPQRQIAGVVKAVMPRANLQKNTLQVKLSIDVPPPDLRPELAVKVTFLPDGAKPAAQPAGYAIPAAALIERDGRAGVYVLLDGAARWREVEHTALASGEAEVTTGLSAGDQVIVNPAGLADGQPVKLKAEAGQ